MRSNSKGGQKRRAGRARRTGSWEDGRVGMPQQTSEGTLGARPAQVGETYHNPANGTVKTLGKRARRIIWVITHWSRKPESK